MFNSNLQSDSDGDLDYNINTNYVEHNDRINNRINNRINDRINNEITSQNNTSNNVSIDTVEEEIYIYLNSKDRDILNDDMYNFSINFSSGNNNATINHIIKDIVKIEITEMIIPNFYVNQKESICLFDKQIITSFTNTTDSNNIRLKRLSDLPYILISIDELKNNVYGTNNDINKATFIMKYDDNKTISNKNSGFYTLNSDKYVEYGNINNSILAETDKTMLNFKPLGEQKILFYPTPKGILNNIQISLKNTLGTLFNPLNNYLTLKKIENSNNNRVIIEFNEYFCSDEYNLGDTLLINDSVLNRDDMTGDWRDYNLLTFLNRKEGHSIIGFFGQSENTPISNTKLFNKIYVPFDYNLTLTTLINGQANNGRCSTKDSFGSNNGEHIGVTSGYAINLDKQYIIGIKCTTKKTIHNIIS